MKTIYAVFSGPDADDYVVCTATDERLAEMALDLYIDHTGNLGAYVRPFRLAETEGDLQPQQMFRVLIGPDGKEIRRWETTEFLWAEEYARVYLSRSGLRGLAGSYKTYAASIQAARNVLKKAKGAEYKVPGV